MRRVPLMTPDEPSPSRSTSRGEARRWPLWGQLLMSSVLLFHVAAILSAALASQPSSEVERRVALFFVKYNDLINQGYGYRYYSRLDATVDPRNPRRWGTPIIIAEMEFDRPGGETSSEVVRLPDPRRPSPRLRYQRQLDLAYHLSADPRWAASYARHLCKTRGCARVRVYAREHHIPDLALVREAASGRGGPAVDLDAESTYGPRVNLGEFRCSDF